MLGSKCAWLHVTVLVALAGCAGAEQRSSSEDDASIGPPNAAAREALHAFAPPLSNDDFARATSLRARGLLVRSLDDATRFEQRARRATTFFTKDGLTFAVSSGDDAWALRATMVGAASVDPVPEEEEPSRLVTVSGERPSFARVAWNELYPGIDMVAGPAPSGGTEYQFVLSPGAKVESIAMRWEGATKIEQVEDGVDVVTDIGALRIRGLHAFAIEHGARKELPARHVLRGDTLSFEVDGWDGRTELVIDPVVAWSSFAGGASNDYARALAVDASGNVYVGGATGSSDFPRTVGAYKANQDIFVMKVSPAGSIVWSALYGGTANEQVGGLAVDASGNVYFTGWTNSLDFPATGGFDTSANGNGDALVGKLTPTGAIAWAGYLGGSDSDYGRAIALDGSANVYVTGMTRSTNFPTKNAFQPSAGGSSDAFVTKLSSNGAITWSSYLGGGGFENNDNESGGIAVSNGIFVGGTTQSYDFPVTPGAFKTSVNNGNVHGFLTKLNDGTTPSVAWSTYVTGSASERVLGLAAANGTVFLVGMTSSKDFPVTNGTTNKGLLDAFVVSFTGTGALSWGSYLGGSGNDQAFGIALGSSANVLFVAGSTTSVDFPKTGAFQSTIGGGLDAFVARFNASTLQWSSYLGGSNTDQAYAVAADTTNNVYVAGDTASTDFPLKNAFDGSFANQESFVVRVRPAAVGAACTSAADCGGPCVDGFCCNEPCTAKCKACSNAKTGAANGTCANVKSGTDPDSECAAASCTVTSGTAKATPKQTCNGSGACTTTAAVSCGQYLCNGAACRTNCSNDSHCASTAYCAGSTCTAKKANGTACTANNQCTSGFCVDGYCCNNACTGTCRACSNAKTGAANGTCANVKSGTDPDSECAAATCTGGMATPKQTCNGSGACTTSPAVSCGAYPCSGTACATSCTTDANCASGAYCAGGKCNLKKANGNTCTANNQCTSGFCVDGVCCNSACTGTCMACSNAKTGAADGTCANVKSGTDPDTECAAATCTGGMATPKQTCNGSGACTNSPAVSCGAFPCSGTVCATSCTTDANCASGAYCASGTCAAKKANGEACSAANQCTSGFCVDGVCCESACTGTCMACSAAKKGSGGDGTCGPIEAGIDPENECPGASCTDGMATPKQTCDGAGACTTTPAISCGPFPCSGAACATTCTTDTDCAASAWCDAGTCVAKASNGAACAAASQCESGFCVDGVCCDDACSGTCMACSAAKKGSGEDGTCAPIEAGTDPEAECPAPTCASGNATPKETCDGTGACTVTTPTSCAPYACAGTDCATSCANDDDCLAPNVCEAGACVPPPEPDAGPEDSGLEEDAEVDTGVVDTGVTDTGSPPPDTGSPGEKPVVNGGYGACTKAEDCASGFCVDGVCCDRACDGLCESCTMPFAPGTCVPVPMGLDPKMQCSAIPCTRTCNGAGDCINAFAGAQCAPARCTGPNTGAGPAVCPAEGAACPTDESIPFDCGAYACAPALGACFQMCASSDQCAPGFVCDLGTKSCVPGSAPTDDDGGCSVVRIGGGGRTGAVGSLLALAALLALRRRRAGEGRVAQR